MPNEIPIKNPNHTCTRCGECCSPKADRDTWVGGDLTWEEKQSLLEERKKYPENEGCKMLYWENDIAVCLFHTLGMEDKLDMGCKTYPEGDTLCLREERIKNEEPEFDRAESTSV